MKRIIDAQLINWKNSSRRKPLIVRGARQIGKTWSIEHFGKTSFKHFYKIDLEKRPDLHFIFEGNLDPHFIISQLELHLNTSINIEESLLFFDEIQACPRALLSLRYFYEDLPQLHVIAAGSLLEFALDKISFPVGRIQFAQMEPLSFSEYLMAIGKSLLANKINEAPVVLPPAVHNLLISELRNYMFIGGMPECVQAYIKSKSMLEAFKVQDEIIESYRQDFSKYTPRANRTCLNMILENAAQQVGEQGMYSKMAEGFSNPTIHKNFDLIAQGRLIHKIPSTDPSGLPMGAGANIKKFKTLVLDIGLMQRLCHLSVAHEIKHEDLLAMYKGKLAEQFVGQELRILQNSNLYYWARTARSSNAEVDFLVQKESKIHPVEVKSGKGGSLKSLHLFLDKYKECGEGYVLYSGPYAELPEKKLCFLPLYYCSHLAKNDALL
ncbi:MAG: ATP-binding protein [Lentisphaeraceae bacterium]|nr:ATP-binding protein [Lentisphaeraceae bacterium]